MVPSAPGLASTTTVLRHLFPSASAIIRAAASFALPAGNVTIIFTVRSGQSARAETGRATVAQAAAASKRESRRARHTRLSHFAAAALERRAGTLTRSWGGHIIITGSCRLRGGAFADRFPDVRRRRSPRSRVQACPSGLSAPLFESGANNRSCAATRDGRNRLRKAEPSRVTKSCRARRSLASISRLDEALLLEEFNHLAEGRSIDAHAAGKLTLPAPRLLGDRRDHAEQHRGQIVFRENLCGDAKTDLIEATRQMRGQSMRRQHRRFLGCPRTRRCHRSLFVRIHMIRIHIICIVNLTGTGDFDGRLAGAIDLSFQRAPKHLVDELDELAVRTGRGVGLRAGICGPAAKSGHWP